MASEIDEDVSLLYLSIDCFFLFLKVVRSDLAQVEKQLAIAKKQLEEETLMRVDLENRFQSLKEELLFKNQVYEQVYSAFVSIGV